MWHKTGLFLILLGISSSLLAQWQITGVVYDEFNHVVPGVTVQVKGKYYGTTTGKDGTFRLTPKTGEEVTLLFSHIQYEPAEFTVSAGHNKALTIILKLKTTQLEGVEITRKREREHIETFTRVDAKAAQKLPSAFGDFNKLLVTLPGVASNNELSSAYSVRGGNFDENLVYVNDIPVYRPFLSNAGRQEGLSFVNPNMVAGMEFYAGGWEPKYGDKLSSSLNIEYKEPDSQEGSVTLGLLGGTAYFGGSTGRMAYLVGARHRDSRYLLNTLETEGQYFPTYSDVQSLLTFDLTSKRSSFVNRTKLNWLLAYGRNRYLTMPASLETDFGSVQQNFRVQTAFIGREILDYDTYQTGFRLTHWFDDRLRTHVIGSALYAREKEQFDVEGAYRLSDVSSDPGPAHEKSVVIRGLGTNYDYGRNSLRAQLYSLENRYEYLLRDNTTLEAGAGVVFQQIDDELNEYSFIDSADYVTITRSVFNDLNISSRQYFGYLQGTTLWHDSVHAVVFGARVNYWDYNRQLLVSPRLAYRFSPKWAQKTTFKLSAGYYQQPPFYRELRNYEGELNPDAGAQRSIHFIGGFTRIFYMWARPFLFNTDLYYKRLMDVIPYEIDNLKLRYYPDQRAKAYAAGVDFRVHGEFIKGTQSWFSLGILRTMEDIEGDGLGYIRRPADQRVNLAVYFEDHMPNDPSLRVYLNLVFGSGFPFGPPQRPDLRNAFSGDEYYRADIGLSKSFDFVAENFFNHLWIKLEVLNALGTDNTLSYTWIEDVGGNQFAVPNSLSARFLNIKLTAEL